MRKLLIISWIVLSLVMVGCNKTSIIGGAVIDEPVKECKDNDGGINKDIQGAVSIRDKNFTDECVAGLLIEYYCDGNNKANQNIRCPNKCDSGKCV